MENKSILVLSAACILFLANCLQPNGKELSETYDNIEFEMAIVQEPVIPDHVVNILDFGAISGGQVLNTQAFADAIDSVSKLGGGKIIIPAGMWLTGPISLKSNIELYTETGALVKFSANKDLYPVIPTNFEGLITYRCMSPISGKEIENIAFTGKGVWDGSGEVWRPVKKMKLTESQWKKLVSSGGVIDEEGKNWYPSEQYRIAKENAELNVRKDIKTIEDFEAIRDFLRPVMVSIQNSKRVLIDGPTFQNSPAWCLHPLIVEDLIVRNTTVRNPWYSQNGDGIDIESCKNVIIENSNFDVGDDAICIKSGKDRDGRLQGIPCENLIIRNNIVYHGHGGVTVGSEMSGGVKNMHVSNCIFMGTDVGLRFKSKRGRGGIVENIFISDILMTDIPTNAISFNLYYGGKSVSEMMDTGGMQTATISMPVTEETPQFRNIMIKNIMIKGAHQAVFLQGLPEMNLENIKISNLLADADNGFYLTDVDGVTISDISINTKNEKVFDIFNCKNVSLSGIEFSSTLTNAVSIKGKKCENIELTSTPQFDFATKTTVGSEVPKGAVKL